MGIRVTDIALHHAKQIVRRHERLQASTLISSGIDNKDNKDVPKSYFAVYVGEEVRNKKRFVIPVSCLNHPSFQDLLSQVAEEFGFGDPSSGWS